MSNSRQCVNCRFFARMGDPTDPTEDPWGDCRRYAPRPGVDSSEPTWPSVYDDEWCGEYECGREGEKA